MPITNCLAYLDVCINPSIYAVISPAFRRLFCCPSTQSGRGDAEQQSVPVQEQTVKYRPDKGDVDFEHGAG